MRGKVDFLFQRYTAEQELTSMLLCVKPSNMEVTTLAGVVDEWIAVTHGKTPEARMGKPVLLFFCLTMFDDLLTETVHGEEADPSLRFKTRMEASLLKPFGKFADSWPRRWTTAETFKNCFWIRSPNYKAEAIIQYEGRIEAGILPGKKERLMQLRDASASVSEVRAHFKDPVRAFDEAIDFNDGGISYLAQSLSNVCRAGMKEEQVGSRLVDLRAGLARILEPHYVPTDLDKRLRENSGRSAYR